MTLNIIHDSRRQERYDPLMEQLQRQGITDFVLWPCIMLNGHNGVVKSINASHKMIVRDAKEKGLSEVCIGEDDLYFPADNGWQHFLVNKPQKFDVYVACTYLIPIEQKKLVGFHLYIVHEKFYDQFLSVPDEKHIDTAICDLGGDYKICYPFAALQRPGFSMNNMAHCNYNAILREEDVYGKFR